MCVWHGDTQLHKLLLIRRKKVYRIHEVKKWNEWGSLRHFLCQCAKKNAHILEFNRLCILYSIVSHRHHHHVPQWSIAQYATHIYKIIKVKQKKTEAWKKTLQFKETKVNEWQFQCVDGFLLRLNSSLSHLKACRLVYCFSPLILPPYFVLFLFQRGRLATLQSQ